MLPGWEEGWFLCGWMSSLHPLYGEVLIAPQPTLHTCHQICTNVIRTELSLFQADSPTSQPSSHQRCASPSIIFVARMFITIWCTSQSIMTDFSTVSFKR